MSYQDLEVSIEDHVATVTLARTDSMNALSLRIHGRDREGLS